MSETSLNFDRQEINDLLSAISFFLKEYPKKGSKQTRKAMELLSKKLWKELKKF